MGVRVKVSGKVVSGNQNGGENLYLCFTATEDDSTAKFVLELEDDEVEWERVDELVDDETALWRVKTFHYEFEWVGSKEDLKMLFAEAGGADQSKWRWAGPVTEAPTKRFVHEHYVDGNAD